ncbi:hypothetical protein O3M35_002501 [Rhynocoris fuscipes]|uniref:Uncharacterized protein n=1 Tax=Rhynocoris fuscipes TaxID=488301 RepID=A0AAW1CT79_9HEMI
MCFLGYGKWHSVEPMSPKKLMKSKLSNIRREYKKILRWLKPFLRYGAHKIRNFQLFCWQQCWSD